MKTKRMLALLMTLIMAMSCLGMSVYAEGPEAFTVGEGKTVYVSASEDVDEYAYFSFTPEQSGSYAFCVEGVDSDNMEQYVWLSVELDGEDVTTDVYEDCVCFDGEMGVTYTLSVNFWGVYAEDAEYTFYVEPWEAPEPTALVEGENLLNVPYEGLSVSFAPEQSGYYLISVDEDDSAACWMDAETVNDKTDEYYVMEAGETYYGDILNFEDDAVVVTVYIEYVEDVTEVVPVAIELVDDSPLQIVEYSCGLDIGILGLGMEGWMYLPLNAYTREVQITFSDGSVVTALPGDMVYGIPVDVIDNQGGTIMSLSEQPEGFWSKDTENYVTFCYGELYTELAVEIVDSPVASVEMVTPPKNDTVMVDEDFEMINAEGEVIESIRDMFDGMSLKVSYKDGTVKTFAADEVEWISIEGEEFPFVDGYPVGVIGGLIGLLGENAEMVPPCELEIVVEYMGVETSYTFSVVEEFEEEPPVVEPPVDNPEDEKPPVEQPEIEPNPETGDMDTVVLVAVVAIASMLSMVAVIQKKKTF